MKVTSEVLGQWHERLDDAVDCNDEEEVREVSEQIRQAWLDALLEEEAEVVPAPPPVFSFVSCITCRATLVSTEAWACPQCSDGEAA